MRVEVFNDDAPIRASDGQVKFFLLFWQRKGQGGGHL
jgi:hypothetical protein